MYLFVYKLNTFFLPAVEDQLDVMKTHLDQFKEIGESNEHAISELSKVSIIFVLHFQNELSLTLL